MLWMLQDDGHALLGNVEAPGPCSTGWPWSFIYFFAIRGFELRAYTLSHSTSLFVVGFFDRVLGTVARGWL
jgi:hypothetical protein